MDELPVCKKCCFCVPLRYGLLTWGYLKLSSALLLLFFFTITLIELSAYLHGSEPVITIIAIVLAVEIVLHIIFIAGAHKKNLKLLRIYYYYAVFMWAVTIVVGIGSTIFLIVETSGGGGDRVLSLVVNILNGTCFTISIIVQTFLVISLRSEIIKLRSNCPYRFVKNEKEPEGTITTVKSENTFIGNGSEHIIDNEDS